MYRSVLCNYCDAAFSVTEDSVFILREGDIEVQYFSCPKRGHRYMVLTTDTEMRELISQRAKISAKLKAAHAGKYRAKTIQTYMQEMEKIKVKQERLMLHLNPTGRKLLEGEKPTTKDTGGTAHE